MTVGSIALPGVDAKISINAKSGTVYSFDGRITSYDKEGFEKIIEYRPTQGVYFESIKPISPATIKFGVLQDVDSASTSLTFDDIIGSPSTQYAGIRQNQLNPSTNTPYKIKIEFINYTGVWGTLGTSDEAYKELYYNAKGIRFTKNNDANGNLSGTFDFIVAPFNNAGSSNYIEIEKIAGTATTNYTLSETNKDTEMGY